jgi:hypothetical protein
MTAEMPEGTREVAVLGCGAFVPGFDGLSGWARGEASADHDSPKAELVPLRQRRRASVLSKAMADAYADALATTGLDAATVASVFGSAIGEATTMVGLLDQMWGEAAMLSPMKFATSVHNAASGLISIATENRGITTAVGADYDTPAMSLLEGIGLVLSKGESVVVCCGDEAPPEDLVPEGAGWGLMSAAIVLGPIEEAPADCIRLAGLSAAAADPLEVDSADADGGREAVRRNPNIGLLDLAVVVSRGESRRLRLDRGAGRGFGVRVEAPRGGA